MPACIVSGRVVLKESGVGIPDLLVVIYELDSAATPPQGSEKSDVQQEGEADSGREDERDQPTALRRFGDRLGSQLTDNEGRFDFSFEKPRAP